MVTRVPTRMITTTGVQAGSYTAADITVNEAGQITSAASNSVVVSGGGGPKISGVAVTDGSWTVLDDTAVDVLGGYIKITGSGFSSGCLVYFNQTAASSVSFVSSSELRVTTGALLAGTYVVYAINTDGGVAISVPGVTFSATPGWQTSSSLSDQYDGTAITLSLVASEATSYTLVSGSLPPGLSLNSSTGAITGTVVGVTVDTTYTFTVRARDAQNQDSPRTFTVTITVSDPYFKLTTLLLGGEQGNTIVRDSSVNNFNLTVYGDSRATNFTPYGTGWSVYFDGTGDYLTVPDNAAFQFGTGDFTMELWVWAGTTLSTGAVLSLINKYIPGIGNESNQAWQWYIYNDAGVVKSFFQARQPGSSELPSWSTAIPTYNTQWNHAVVVRSGNNLLQFWNGVLTATTSYTVGFNAAAGASLFIGARQNDLNGPYNGYISNIRIVKGTALYTANFTPATTNLTAVANTSLLTCHANRFLDGSTNNFAITRNGDVKVVSFNPFNLTNTGVNGSAYFDGTGDYITVPDNVNLEPLGGNFTIEVWFYLNAVTTGTQICGKSWWTPFYIEGANLVTYLSSNGSTWDIASNQVIITSVGTSRWYHVAMVRNGTSIKAYVNGTEALSLTSSAALHDGSDTLTIGARGTTYLNGYVSDLRFIKGTAVYTANFTPPTQPLTAIANTQLLTLQYKQPHNNHSFQDSSTNNHLITRSGNATQGTFSPFSQTGWGNYFNGSSYLSAGTTLFNYTTGNASTTTFTIEAFIYLNSYQTAANIFHNPCIISKGDIYLNLGVNGSGNLIFYHFDGTIRSITGSSVIPLATWTYVAVTVTGGTATLYVNGTSVGSGTWYGIQAAGQNTTSLIGRASTNASSLYINGYISNLRVSTIVRTITTPTTAYTNDANTALLTAQSNRFIDNSSSPITLTVTGSPTVVAFSPFNPTALWSAATNGGSGYFDGSGDYLTAGSATDWTFLHNGSSWTVEFDVFHSVTTITGIVSTNLTTGSVGFGVLLNNSAANKVEVFFTRGVAGSEAGFSSNAALVINSWNHVAITFDTSTKTCSFYINGAAQGSSSNTGFAYSSSTPTYTLAIGRYQAATPGGNLTGYLSNVRISNTVRTGLTTLPTSPYTSDANTSLLLNFTNAGIYDATSKNVLETVDGAQISTTQSKWGGSSMSFDGTGDGLTSNIATFDLYAFGTGAFTVEFWLYLNSTSGVQICIDFRPLLTNGPQIILFTNAGVLTFQHTSAVRITGSTLATGQWYHIALARSGTDTKMFLNGTQTGSTYTSDTTSYTVGANRPAIGADGANLSINNLNGYLQDVRITKGYARYTGNFTPPAVAHRLK